MRTQADDLNKEIKVLNNLYVITHNMEVKKEIYKLIEHKKSILFNIQ